MKTHLFLILFIAAVCSMTGRIKGQINEMDDPADDSGPCWTELAAMHEPRAAHVAEMVNGKIYAMGGHADGLVSIEVYDTASGAWTMVGNMPTRRVCSAHCVVDGKIYVIGGFLGQNYSLVEVYDPATNNWTEKSSMINPKWGHTAVFLNGKIYVFGGVTNWLPETYYETMEIYEVATDTWVEKECPITPRWFTSASAVNGKIYVVGGFGKDTMLSDVDVYDPVSDTWSSGTPLQIARCGVATTVANNKIYAFGGFGNVSLKNLDERVRAFQTTEQYDPETDTWATRSPMPAPRANQSPVVINNIIYLPGGGGADPNHDYTEFFVYDPLCDTIADQRREY